MTSLYPDLDSAITEILENVGDQDIEFKRRLRRLIENAATGNLADDDVREVIELATVSDAEED